MSTEPAVPCRTLGEYVAELVERLGSSDPGALMRLREVVGARRTRISLDGEAVEIFFGNGGLTVAPAGEGGTDGEGSADRATTLDLLDGCLEVTDALLDGWLEARGTLDDVTRMFHAIEILLDASTRSPSLQALASDYRNDPCRPIRGTGRLRTRSTPFPPDGLPDDEAAVLRRLELLP